MFATMFIVYLIENNISSDSKANYHRFVIGALAIILTAMLDFRANGTKELPLGFEAAFFMVCFVEIGILLKNSALSQANTILYDRYYILIISACILVTALISFVNGFAQVRNYDFGKSIFLFIISSVLGSIATLLISMWINSCCFLEIIGRNSLFILLFHKFPIIFFQSVLPVTKELLSEENGNSFISNIVGIIISFITIFMLIIASRILIIIKNKVFL